MTDEVNNPSHYNRNGIEVIDVIETYTPDSPHLANVLKYVCRHSYKGKPLEDLRKAAWYLARAIDIVEIEEADRAWVEQHMDTPEAIALREDIRVAVLNCFDVDATDVDATDVAGVSDPLAPTEPQGTVGWDEYGRVTRCSPPVNIDGDPIDEHGDPIVEPMTADWSIVDEIERYYPGTPAQHHQDFCEQQSADYYDDTSLPQSVVDALYVRTSPSRIAGDDEAAARIKNEYYAHNPFEIAGYCAECDRELTLDCDYLCNQSGFDGSLKFCSYSCVNKLREWQGR